MNRSILFDVLFILVTAGILLLFSETGNFNIVSRYAFVFILGGYLIGKYAARRKV